MSSTVGIVVPAYRPAVDSLVSYVDGLEHRLDPTEIRIELDAPRSGVSDRLAETGITVNQVPERRGKGAAITAGFEALDTDVLAFADADGATSPAEFARVVEPVVERVADGPTTDTDGSRSRGADVAVGSRRHPDASVTDHQGVARRVLGDGFAWLARRTLEPDLYDYQCGAKAVTADAWNEIRNDVTEPGFAWDIEFLALAGTHGFTVSEVPIEWEDQPGSTVDPVWDSLDMIRGLAAARHRSKLAAGSSFHRAIARDAEPLVDRNGDRPDVTASKEA